MKAFLREEAKACPVAKYRRWIQRGTSPATPRIPSVPKSFLMSLAGGSFLSSTRLVNVLCANRVVIRLPSAEASRSLPDQGSRAWSNTRA